MNYISTITSALGALLPDCADEPDLLRLYALLVLTTGTGTSLEDVHDAWAVYRSETKPDHPALVPFSELAPEVRELDRPYRDAIRTVAAGRPKVAA
jgi:hypothetical protein